MLKAFKTEINPTDEQKKKINKTIGTCRFIYNFYLVHNKELHESGQKFMSGKAFSIWLNNEYLPAHPEKTWLKDVSSKSVKRPWRTLTGHSGTSSKEKQGSQSSRGSTGLT